MALDMLVTGNRIGFVLKLFSHLEQVFTYVLYFIFQFVINRCGQ